MKQEKPIPTAVATDTFYKPGINCWRTGKAEKAALLIDCANYYRALYFALCKAKHSIFILGWDIDSRIELLRGEEAAKQDIPARLFDLIKHKAENNPDLHIYLNRWNYSVFFVREREAFSGWKWRLRMPMNVNYCTDYNLPFTACHHQKVIIIDDEVAFCGGMDIALGRWDKRQHYVDVPERIDPGGITTLFRRPAYQPYHDIQLMLQGPVVDSLAQLVRDRWKGGSGVAAIEPARPEEKAADIWPAYVKPDFENITVGICRTLPRTRQRPTVSEILEIYCDQIARAESFIYIENQYLTSPEIARALNKRMREKPQLRVLAVSSDHPRGFMEHKAMWTGRVDFYDTMRNGIDPDRHAITYPITKENGTEKTIHIHSKLMIVDDRFLHIGSSNLNNRSMGCDTECDIVIAAENDAQRARIAALRNDLIREHTGQEKKRIDEFINTAGTIKPILEYQQHSRQHLRPIDNEPYRDEMFRGLTQKIGDPRRAHILLNLPVRQIIFNLTFLLLLGLLLWSWLEPVFADFFNRESITNAINNARDSQYSILWVVGIYIIAGAVFFPVTVLNLTTAIVFGPIMGVVMSLAGSVASATVSFIAGHFVGTSLIRFFRPMVEKVQHYVQRGGVMGMTLIRLAPIAPYTLINLTFGASHVAYGPYVTATILGLLPGIIAKAMFGGAIGRLWENPEPRVVFFAVGSLLLWLLVIWGSHRVFSHYKKEMES